MGAPRPVVANTRALRLVIERLAAVAASLWIAAAAVAADTLDATEAIGASDATATDRVIVKLRDMALTRMQAARLPAEAADRVAALSARSGIKLRLARSVSARTHALRFERDLGGAALRGAVARLAADPAVEYAQPDHRRYPARVPNDPLYGPAPITQQWWLTAPNATLVAAIDAEKAWDVTTGSSDVVVAVLDSGVLFDHPDLARVQAGGKLLAGYDMVSEPLLANDGEGRDPDASDPGDWVTAEDVRKDPFKGNGCAISDSTWHGTQVAGIVGARTDNGAGGAGVGGATTLLPVRVLGKCFGYESDVQAGMRWAAGLTVPGVALNPTPARVINLSLGTDPGQCSALDAAAVTEVIAAGALVVAAAGNGGRASLATPADCPGVIAVGALRHTGQKVGFSNWGAGVALSAPGGNCVNTDGGPCLYPILSASNDGKREPGNMTYAGGLGTSYSTPMVSGVAALMIAANPNITVADLSLRLRATARAFPPADPDVLNCDAASFAPDGQGVLPNDGMCNCTATTCGAGMLDAAGAVRSAVNPVALIGAPARVAAGQTVMLDGGASLPTPGYTALVYAWSGQGGGYQALGALDQPTLSFCGSAGVHTVSLTVSDANGSDTRTVTIEAVGGGRCAGDSGAGEEGGSAGGNGGGGNLTPAAVALLILSAFAATRRRRVG